MKKYPKTTVVHAQTLRSSGSTYREICDLLGEKIPKATLNYWVRDIIPPPFYKQKITDLVHANIKNVHKLALKKNREILESLLHDIRSKNTSLIFQK